MLHAAILDHSLQTCSKMSATSDDVQYRLHCKKQKVKLTWKDCGNSMPQMSEATLLVSFNKFPQKVQVSFTFSQCRAGYCLQPNNTVRLMLQRPLYDTIYASQSKLILNNDH